MDVLSIFETFLYVVSSLLFYPVVISLTILVFYMVFILGIFVREYAERKKGVYWYQQEYEYALNKLIRDNHADDILEIKLEKLLQDSELKLIKSLDRIKFVIRVGPALGLMGTLIPMGIALAALAQGDMPKMAGNMVTAFTTTVVGLACGVLSYIISIIKERWIREDIKEMEFLTDMILIQKKKIINREASYEVS